MGLPSQVASLAARPRLACAQPPADAAPPALPAGALGALAPLSGARLGAEELGAYHQDLLALVVAHCRLARGLQRERGIDHLDAAGAEQLAAALALLAPADPDGDARLALARAEQRFSRWQRPGTPLGDVIDALGLSATAARILVLAAAPAIRGEAVRAYQLIAGARQYMSEMLLQQLMDGGCYARLDVALELDEGAALRRHGAVELDAEPRPLAGLSVHPVLVRRLSGVPPERLGHPGLTVRAAGPDLEALRAPRAALAQLVGDLAGVRRLPPRIVLRGRLGSGRRTLAAALAAQAGRKMVPIEPLVGRPAELLDCLRRDLCTATLAGHLPCVTVDVSLLDPAQRAALGALLDGHPGPLFVRIGLADSPPIGPGYLGFSFPTQSEGERLELWQDALRGRGWPTDCASELAARFHATPGQVARTVEHVGCAAPAEGLAERLVEALRQHRGDRVAQIATRVRMLAGWDDLIVPADIAQRLRELVDRIRHRRVVLDQWGMRRLTAGASGVTALLQGGPGSGKSMAAGVLARELGCELWRVDLSRVMSKWIGETEQALGRLFDAAEDGDVVLLFDEADSLFGKRTQVDSSNDRYANTQVNYLLQRLDAFDGLAILTTNFGTAIDPAFRRRLALQLELPFPEEVERATLWDVHLPAAVPRSPELDLAALAKRFALSAGYVRNAALRAAYLAAREGGCLEQRHLQRAIEAEYLDAGRTAAVGKLE